MGCARAQISQVHVPGDYDMWVDTGKDNPTKCAQQILDFVANNEPRAFDRVVPRYDGRLVNTYPVPWW